MRRIKRRLLTLLLAALCLPVTAAAQSAGELPPELLACAEETDVALRLACFDREMAKLNATPEPVAEPVPAADTPPQAPPATPVAPAPVVADLPAEPETAEHPAEPVVAPVVEAAPAAAATAAETAVIATAPAAVTAAEAVSPATAAETPTAPTESDEDFGLPDDGPDTISATVTDIRRRAYGEMVILLDNGQIWEQKHRDSRFRLDVGDDVTISEGLISGYRLTGGGRNNSIQVERLK